MEIGQLASFDTVITTILGTIGKRSSVGADAGCDQWRPEPGMLGKKIITRRPGKRDRVRHQFVGLSFCHAGCGKRLATRLVACSRDDARTGLEKRSVCCHERPGIGLEQRCRPQFTRDIETH